MFINLEFGFFCSFGRKPKILLLKYRDCIFDGGKNGEYRLAHPKIDDVFIRIYASAIKTIIVFAPNQINYYDFEIADRLILSLPFILSLLHLLCDHSIE